MEFAVGFVGIIVLVGAIVGVVGAVFEGPWWRRGPIPGQYWTLPGLGPVLVESVSQYSDGVRFTNACGNTVSVPLESFKWQARATTREAFDVAVARERILKGGTP